MSQINELGDQSSSDVKLRYKNLAKILGSYINEIGNIEQKIQIKGKTLEQANKENPSEYYYYDKRRVELSTLVKYFEREIDRVRGKLFRGFTENNPRDISDRAKDKYIDCEQAYLDVHEYFLEVKEIYEEYVAICEAFKTRGYSLNNITKIRVASLENAEL